LPKVGNVNLTKREWLSSLRRSHRYSQKALADEVGVSSTTVKNWESGDGFPSSPNKLELARVLGRDVLDFFYREECDLLSQLATA